ncbi:MAG: hypothetical protein ACREX8_03645, partial [Gammaproteobacteria bacterium]
NIRPSEETEARFVRRPDELPSLVISDGSAVVWFCPPDGPAGPELAAEFADRLMTTAGHWLRACGELAAPSRQRPYASAGR